MVVKLSEGVLTGKALPADEAEEEVTAALRDVSPPPWIGAVDVFVAAFKQALKSLRTTRGMTQGALAEAVGVSTSTISRLEGDAATPVDLAMLGEILHHLNVGLRCELLVDSRSMEVAVRPAEDVERRPDDDRRVIAQGLRDIRQRIEAIERNLGTDLADEGEMGVEVVMRAAVAASGKKAGSDE